MHSRLSASLCVAPRANGSAIPLSLRLASPASRRSRCSRGLVHGLLLGLLCAHTVSASACDAGPSPTEDVSVRDSGGVRIVENRRALWGPEEGWRLADSPSLVIEVSEDGEGPYDPASVFRTSGGEIVVADGYMVGEHRVLVYDAEGRLQREMGRAGEGPCEFSQLWWALPYRGDSIAAYDQGGHAVSVFATDGSCGRTIKLPMGTPRRNAFYWGAVGPYPDGSILAHPFGDLEIPSSPGPAWYHHSLLRVGRDGASDTLGRFRATQVYWTGEATTRLAFARSAVSTLDGFDLIHGDQTSFEFRRFDAAGALKQIVRLAVGPVPVTEDELTGFLAGFEHHVDTEPAYSALLVDASGNTWVEGFRHPDPAAPPKQPLPGRWYIFARDGRWLGGVDMPGRLRPVSAYGDMVLGIWTDDFGVRSVRAHALIKPATVPARQPSARFQGEG